MGIFGPSCTRRTLHSATSTTDVKVEVRDGHISEGEFDNRLRRFWVYLSQGDFKVKLHQIRFRLGIHPYPTAWEALPESQLDFRGPTSKGNGERE